MDGPTKEGMRILLDEARHVLEVQTQGIRALDERSGTLLRFNVLLLGVLGTGASLFVRSGARPTTIPIAAAGFAASVAILLGSTLSTALAYRAIRWEFGVRAESLEGALRFETDEKEILQATLVAYTGALGRNSSVSDAAVGWLDRALLGLVGGLVLLAATAIRLWWMGIQA